MDIVLLITLILILLIILSQLFYHFVFLRDPIRQIPYGPFTLVSPADGIVQSIMAVDQGKEINLKKGIAGTVKTICSDVSKKAKLVVITMNILDVHIQRSPLAGKVEYVKHCPGKFKNALVNPKKLFAIENEKTEILIKSPLARIKVVQVAGLVARRIHTYTKKSEKVMKGEKIGIIKMGSMVLLVVPSYVDVKVREGQRVYAGKDIIAQLPKDQNDKHN